MSSEIASPLLQLIEEPRPCSYLPEQTASLEYRCYQGLEPAALEQLVSRGWRRFGMEVFRPACSACVECRPIRIDVARFRPSKSQRRLLRKNRDVRISCHPATVTDDHIRLYNAWHDDMTLRRGWRPQRHRVATYARSFLAGEFPSAMEVRYESSEGLVGIGLIDVMPRAISSAYFYHDPDWRAFGPGTFSLLCEVALARQLQLDYVYLGYWIQACPSMSYKNRFPPQQILLGRPGDDEAPRWAELASNSSSTATNDD